MMIHYAAWNSLKRKLTPAEMTQLNSCIIAKGMRAGGKLICEKALVPELRSKLYQALNVITYHPGFTPGSPGDIKG